MLELERVTDGYLPLDALVHGVRVGLVHTHTLLGQGRGIVDGHLVELRVQLPVLVCVRRNRGTNEMRWSMRGKGLLKGRGGEGKEG